MAEIHSADEMLDQARLENGGDVDAAAVAYLGAGAQIARTIETYARAQWSELASSWSLLDFGSGYGRVTRFLCAALQAQGVEGSRIWTSDLLTGAVRFQREVLRTESFVSDADPEKVSWPRGDFDLIYVGSLFTHLPRRTFDTWLEVLFGRLSIDGTLLFSVHDLRLKPAGVAVDDEGFAFIESSESRELDHAVYGSTWIGPRALRRALDELARRASVSLHWRRYPRALCGFQDLVAVSRREIACERLGCVGQIDRAELAGDKYEGSFDLRLAGWSLAAGSEGNLAGEEAHPSGAGRDADERESPGVRVEAQLISEPSPDAVASTHPEAERVDLDIVRRELCAEPGPAGWTLELQLPTRVLRGRDLLLVTARGEGQAALSTVLYAGTIDRLLLDRMEEHYRLRRDRVYELAETIEQVKQSRFWRLRAAWFRWKRRLGWTSESPTGPDLEPSDQRPRHQQ